MPSTAGPKLRERFPRSAADDLWRHTLSQVPSTFGKLVYLASLRDVNSGRYLHHGLGAVFGEDNAHQALKTSHEEVFSNWLGFSLEQQRTDLDQYLGSLETSLPQILATWATLKPYSSLPPDTSRGLERNLFLSDLEMLLKLMLHEHGVSVPDPDA